MIAMFATLDATARYWKTMINREILELAEKEEEERRKNVDLYTRGRRAKRKAVYKIRQLKKRRTI